ncbi:MAG: methyltransferase domain-containing protein [Pseudomonadales bacterium]|nr:methyltransferase domain-containing protein [Pseudomonadales bacterium]
MESTPTLEYLQGSKHHHSTVTGDGSQTSKLILVTGMHRSGTSALAGLLHQSGVSAGPELIPAQAGVNDKGFFEDPRVVALNDRIFSAFFASWLEPENLPTQWWTTALAAAYLAEIQDLLRLKISERTTEAAPVQLLIKDPRLMFLYPLWQEAADKLGLNTHYVLICRSMESVVASLQHRDDLPPAAGKLLWMRYMLQALPLLTAGRASCCTYERVLNDSAKVVRELSEELRINVGEPPRGFITAKLNHHHCSFEDLTCRKIYDAVVHEDTEALIHWRAVLSVADEFYQPLQSIQAQLIRDHGEGLIQAKDQIRKLESSVRKHQQHIELQTSQARAHCDNQASLNAQIYALRAELQFSLSREKALQDKLRLTEKKLDAHVCGLAPAVSDDVVYEAAIDLRVLNNAHSKIASSILQRGRERAAPLRILEVGCSSGYLGKFLKSAGHEVWGIETQPIAVARASKCLDYVYPGTVQSFIIDHESENQRFDIIIFGDVLEHLADPADILRACRKLLTHSGEILASVPNVSHEAVRLMLLEGRWEYQKTGIMDQTHLRFFSRDTLVSLFTETGYKITSMDTVTLPLSNVDIGISADIYRETRHLPFDDDKDVFQFVVTVMPAADDRPDNTRFVSRQLSHVLCLLPLPDSSLADIRLRQPLARFSQLYGGQIRTGSVYSPDPDDIHWADVVILQRESSSYVLNLMQEMQDLGKFVVFEIDDLLLDVPAYLTVHEHCKQMKPWLEEALQQADAVTVSTLPLMKAVSAYNDNVFLCPNCSETAHTPVNQYDAPDATITLLVASSDTVRVDFIVSALKRIQQDFPAVRVIGIGPPGEYLRRTGINVETYPMMEYDHFKAFLATLENVVGIIPLDDSAFNRCKSAIKFFDFAVHGIPSICSDVQPYNDVIENGQNGLLSANTEDDWVAAISAMVAGPLRKAVAHRAMQFTQREFNLNRVAAAWHDVLDNRKKLQRLPAEPLRLPTVLGPSRRKLLAHLLTPASYYYAFRILRVNGLDQLVNRIKSVM